VTDYKKYALGQVENFLYDAMSTDATAEEIYDVIKGVVQDNFNTYENAAAKAYDLLSLLNAGYGTHTPPKAKPVVPPTICDKDDSSQECKKSWNDFWVEDLHRTDYTDEELDAMCAAATSAKKGKVNKWILPVEETKDADTDETEYFITFPDDLLEAADLKEGNQVEWIDQGDGSYLLKKVKQPSWVKGNELARVKTYKEMIDDGWTMTDDGFWIKEN
jgi:bifunctional DNA-binding transcriptional regulator/antitoxin component of YhaV-PrlF toxin-antitoxin module